jgi:hypothetical protein
MMFSLRTRGAVREKTPEELVAEAMKDGENGRFNEGFDKHKRAISSLTTTSVAPNELELRDCPPTLLSAGYSILRNAATG